MFATTAVLDANKLVIVEAFEAINAGRLEKLASHPGFWETRQVIPAARTWFADWRTAFQQQIAEGDQVLTFMAIRMTQVGGFADVVPAGKRVTIEGFSLDQVVDGTVVEHNSTTSWPDVVRQLGVPEFAGWPARESRPVLAARGTVLRAPAAESKAIVADLLVALVRGNAGAADHAGAGALRAEFAALRAAFPDLTLTLVCQLAEGDLVGTRATLRGTHRGALWGFAPTGRAITWDHYSLARVAGGAVVDCRSSADWTAALIQLGLFPAFHG